MTQPPEHAVATAADTLSALLLVVEKLPIDEQMRILIAHDPTTGLTVRTLLERAVSDINAITSITSITSRIIG